MISVFPQKKDKIKSLNNSKKLSPKLLNKLIPLCLVIFLILLIIILLTKVLIIKQLIVNSDNVTCITKNQISNLSGLLNKSYLVINEEESKKHILDKYFCVADLNYKKIFPDKITIDAKARESILVLNAIVPKVASPSVEIDTLALEATPTVKIKELNFEADDASISARFLVDNGGFVYEKIDYPIEGKPNVYIEASDINVGKKFEGDIVIKIIQVLQSVNSLALNPKTIKVVDDYILVDGDTKLVLSLNKDLRSQLASLQLILQKAKINSNVAERIDLRFSKPVVVYFPRAKK